MKKPALLLIFALALFVAGCASKPVDREQFIALNDLTRASMTKTYKGFAQEQLINAAEKALLHTDSDYRIISHRRDVFFERELQS